MSEDKHERTFDPTPKRLEKAREEGQVAKSRDVPTAAIVLAAGGALALGGQRLVQSLVDATTATFRGVADGGEPRTALDVFASSMGTVGWAVLPFFGLVMVAAIAGHLGQTGLLFAPKALMPKLERLALFKKLGELLSPTQALARTGTSILKIGFVGLVVVTVLQDELGRNASATARDMGSLSAGLAAAVLRVLVSAGAALGLAAAVDWLWQRHRFTSQMKMTRDEVRREQREDEGGPEVKAARKRKHRELSLNRILVEVPKADAIVTNPTHYAVALRYVPGKDAAPRVVAKGTDAVALHIRAVARRHGVPVIENRPLARALHAKVKPGRMIPLDHFKAVAEVLAYVYKLKRRGGRSS